MGKPKKDLTNKVFNRLTVLKYVGSSKWLCKCECGKNAIISTANLNNGHTKSCGCLSDESRIKIGEQNKLKLRKYKNLPYDKNQRIIYSRWYNMFKRCNKYKTYLEKKIKICKEWYSFENFYNWAVDNGFKKELTLDRINNSGNYEPNNCRWITQKEQCRNYSKNHLVTYNGETHCLIEWQEILGLSKSKLRRLLCV